MSSSKNRWLALIVLCLGTLMIVLDTTIVNVALPSIKASLGFSEATLAWVINAYMLMYGGFLLLGGRLGDIFGHRRLFLIGLVIFTLASLTCGLATSQLLLIVARAIQGLGGAIVSAVALSLILNMFTESAERAKAMGIYGFVAAGGGSVGVFLGGVLTNSFSWHWNFLVNIPVGIVVFIACVALLPKQTDKVAHKLDIAGAVTITAAILALVYGIVNGNEAGWLSDQTLGTLAVGIILLVLFMAIELRVKAPLIPLGIFRNHNLTVANFIGILWAAAMFAWFFLSALYMQLVLGYNPLQVGLAFLPGNLLNALLSLGISAKLVMRFGVKKPLAIGMLLVAISLLFFAHAPADGSYIVHILPSMILLGVGAGIAFNPVLMAAMNDVPVAESGLASGVVNTAFMMGGALGLAILASVAASFTSMQIHAGSDMAHALLSGYHAAFFIGALFALIASTLAVFGLRATSITNQDAPAMH